MRSSNDGCCDEMNKVLLLLLGCAVQGDQRDKFIERIRHMQTDLQTAIVKQIQRVTEEGDCVLNIRALELESNDQQCACVFAHLERVMKERDSYANCLLEMAQKHESDEGSTTTGSSTSGDVPSRTKIHENRYEGRTPSPSSYKRHVNVELAQAKAEIRKYRDLAEQKDDLVSDLTEELEARKVDLLKLQQEKLELVKDARAAKDYRDELDCLQHKLAKLERLETENCKFKEKLSELEFFKSRVAQLKEENELMHESCSVLEGQLEESQRKASLYLESQTKLAEYQEQVKTLQTELKQERERIEHLLLGTCQQERDLEAEKQKRAALERQVESLNELQSSREDFGSLGSQIADDDKKRILELQLENRKLRNKLESSGDAEEVGELRAKLLRAEIKVSETSEENNVLNERLKSCENHLSQLNIQFKEAKTFCDRLELERDAAQQSLQEARKNFSEFQTEFQNEIKSDTYRKVQEVEDALRESRKTVTDLTTEKYAIEKQMEKLRMDQRMARAEINELKDKIEKLEGKLAACEKQRKALDMERTSLREKNEFFESRFDEMKLKMMSNENIEKRLEANEKIIIEKQNKLNDLECEYRQQNQQLELERKKTDRLREDLIVEKSRCNDLVSKLRSIYTAMQINCDKNEVSVEDEQIISSIDEVIVEALTNARRDADSLRLQRQTQDAELNDLKQELQKLRMYENQALNVSDDRFKELLEENKNVKEQVFLLQERIRELQLEKSSKCAEVASLKRELDELQRSVTNNTKLHNELAKLQVSLRNLQLQEELLRQDNNEMQKQVDLCEKQRQSTKNELDTAQNMYTTLLADHDRLQRLHNMLTTDYDQAKYENSQLKSKLKLQKTACEEISMSKLEVERERRQVEEMKVVITDERQRRENETRNLQTDLTILRDDCEKLRRENNMLLRNSDLKAEELRQLRQNEQVHKVAVADLHAKIDETNRALQSRDLEIAKLQHKIDMLNHLNRTLEEESKALVRQMDSLLAQNQDLLARALNDKDNHYAEQKQFQEKLSSLRRHKEKLEEKIIEQYRMMDNKKIVKEKSTLSPGKKHNNNNNGDTVANTMRNQEKSSTGSATEDSSVQSADESRQMSPVVVTNVLTICKKYQGRYAKMQVMDKELCPTRHEFGKNVMIPEYASIRRKPQLVELEAELISLHGSERGIDVWSPTPAQVHSLPPRPPVRHLIGKTARPPPPPYNSNRFSKTMSGSTKPPPPYPGRCVTPLKKANFKPQDSSTPKSGDDSIVGEGEVRLSVRSKEERAQKALSIYENVDCDQRNENALWYEYGCV
uniref:HOOK_N domain-containing protein n=1 Tax=Syphacia muris TaxID=451379 RepID=A0A0N5AM56_9BILA